MKKTAWITKNLPFPDEEETPIDLNLYYYNIHINVLGSIYLTEDKMESETGYVHTDCRVYIDEVSFYDNNGNELEEKEIPTGMENLIIETITNYYEL